MDWIARAVSWLEFVRPMVIAVGILLSMVVAAACLIERVRTIGLFLIVLAVLVTIVSDFGYFAVALHSQWKVDIFPRDIFRIVVFIAEVLYFFAVFLWPIALLRLITERRVKS